MSKQFVYVALPDDDEVAQSLRRESDARMARRRAYAAQRREQRKRTLERKVARENKAAQQAQ